MQYKILHKLNKMLDNVAAMVVVVVVIIHSFEDFHQPLLETYGKRKCW